MAIKNQAFLITYADSLGGSLPALNAILLRHFSDIVSGGVHLLPPFPSSGDRGFAPQTYFEIEPTFGSWADVRRIGERFDIMLDLMVNHISRQSPYFRDFARLGRASEYADMFLTLDKVWPGGVPRPEDVAKIFLRRPEHPFAEIVIETHQGIERVWATFGTRDWSEQIDLDVNSPKTRAFFIEILTHMSANGVKVLRLDAIGYVIKKPGTSCFFVEPEIFVFMDWMRQSAAQVGIELLPEIHATREISQKLAAHGYWVYDFVLPLLTLHTLFSQSSTRLCEHLAACPRRQFTMLDCHDGIPVQPDINGALEIDEAQRVVTTCLERGANLSRIMSEQHMLRPGYDAHQVNITYFSALGGDADAYLAARAIQFFTPGVPLIYYVGLLAGQNDPASVQQTGERRAINRHNYSEEEVQQALQQPVVQRLLELIRFRNTYPAFNGEFQIGQTDDRHIQLIWHNHPSRCQLDLDLGSPRPVITYLDAAGQEQRFLP